jgi:hypothetical protein
VLGVVPLRGELVGRADDQLAVIERDRHRRLEPGADRGIGKLSAHLIQQALPGLSG